MSRGDLVIRLKVHEMMATRKIFKISDLHRLTKRYRKEGIDKRMLTKLRNEDADWVQLSALEILCKIFECSLSDLIEIVPNGKKGFEKKTG